MRGKCWGLSLLQLSGLDLEANSVQDLFCKGFRSLVALGLVTRADEGGNAR